MCWTTGNGEIAPATSSSAASVQLQAIEKSKEEAERLERERKLEEKKRMDEAEKLRQKEAQEREQQLAKERAREEEEERRRAEERRKAEEAAKERISPTLNVLQFKSLWTSLGTAGSFQCKLKSPPAMAQLTEHLRNQGFHVVFAVTPNPEDIEIGICNVREGGAGPWFMARFLASKLSFSAVMKSEDPNIVTQFVKKFALAKVLKIDTSK